MENTKYIKVSTKLVYSQRRQTNISRRDMEQKELLCYIKGALWNFCGVIKVTSFGQLGKI